MYTHVHARTRAPYPFCLDNVFVINFGSAFLHNTTHTHTHRQSLMEFKINNLLIYTVIIIITNLIHFVQTSAVVRTILKQNNNYPLIVELGKPSI